MSEQTEVEEKIAIREFQHGALFVPCPGNEGKRSKLAWGERDGSPRVTCFTNDPNDINRGIITAPMDPVTANIFFSRFERILRATGEDKDKIACYQTKYENGVATKERILQSELKFGKDANGIVWIMVDAVDRPKIRFDFRVSDWHKFFKADGTPMTESEGSVSAAAGTISMVRDLCKHALNRVFDNPAPKKPRPEGGYQKGNYQKNNNGGGGNNYAKQPPKADDNMLDELPF